MNRTPKHHSGSLKTMCVLLLAVCGCIHNAATACEFDTQCKGDRVCKAAKCVAPRPSTPTPTASIDPSLNVMEDLLRYPISGEAMAATALGFSTQVGHFRKIACGPAEAGAGRVCDFAWRNVMGGSIVGAERYGRALFVRAASGKWNLVQYDIPDPIGDYLNRDDDY